MIGGMAVGKLGINTRTGKIISSAVIGGTASKLTGGKFVNGAVTAAFAATMVESYGNSRADGDGDVEPLESSVGDGLHGDNKLRLHRDGDTLKGNYSLYCGNGTAKQCSSLAQSMEKINQVVDGIKLDISITPTSNPFTADIDASWWGGRSSTDSGIISQNMQLNRGVGYSVFSNQLSAVHELGHALGLRHQWNDTNRLMSYSSSRTNQISSKQMEALWLFNQ